ncbi:MAG TPA: hypothetical protein VLN47_08815 [Clostridiaceae bacterium]|nr:hypothetical protein [Clostridiaceae bacterium]
MRKELTPFFKAGLLIAVAEILIDRFVTPIPNFIAIPLLVLAIILILVGGWRKRV